MQWATFIHPRPLSLAAGLAVILLSGGGCESTSPSEAPAPPREVAVSHPTMGPVTDFVERTGRTDAVKSVEIHSRVSGYLETIAFDDEPEVQKGKLLFQIDDRPFRADLDSLNAQVQPAPQGRPEIPNAGAGPQQETSPLLSSQPVGIRVERGQAGPSRGGRDGGRGQYRKCPAHRRVCPHHRADRRPHQPCSSHRRQPGGADQDAAGHLVSDDPMYVYFDLDEPTPAAPCSEPCGEGKIKMKARPARFRSGWLWTARKAFRTRGTHRTSPITGGSHVQARIQLRGVFRQPQAGHGQADFRRRGFSPESAFRSASVQGRAGAGTGAGRQPGAEVHVGRQRPGRSGIPPGGVGQAGRPPCDHQGSYGQRPHRYPRNPAHQAGNESRAQGRGGDVCGSTAGGSAAGGVE